MIGTEGAGEGAAFGVPAVGEDMLTDRVALGRPGAAPLGLSQVIGKTAGAVEGHPAEDLRREVVAVPFPALPDPGIWFSPAAGREIGLLAQEGGDLHVDDGG